MKRLTKLTCAILLGMVCAAAAGLVWLAGTTAGARWLLEAISRHAGPVVSVRTVEGRLLDHLHLEGVHILTGERRAELALLDLRWQPLKLLAGRVAVNELTLGNVTIRDGSPPSPAPADLVWPQLSGFPVWFDLSVDRFRLEKLTYHRLEEPPVTVAAVSATVSWRDMLLSLRHLSAEAPAGRIDGLAEAGFRTPSLHLNLTLVPVRPLGGMDSLLLRTDLRPGRRPEQVAGTVALSGRSGPRHLLELTGEAGLARTAVNLRNMRLVRPGRKGTVGAEGALLFTSRAPRADLKLTVTSLDLSAETGAATDIAGEAVFQGNGERYRGSFSLANRGTGWRSARLAGDYHGDSSGARLEVRSGSLLDGRLQGELAVAWHDGLVLEGSLAGRDLDPARIAPDWTGKVNIDLQGTVSRRGAAPAAGTVAATLRDSMLHGKELHGNLQADFAGGDVRIGMLDLRGAGFDIHAAGRLAERVDIAARVSDLSRLVPGTSGQVDADGWVRWHDRRAGGYLSATGRDLVVEGCTMGNADLTARLGDGPDGPVTVRAHLRKLLYRHATVDSASLALDGTPSHHTLAADLEAAGAQLRIGLAGAWSSGSWQGDLVRLSGRDRSGQWQLDAPARLAVGAGRLSLSPLSLTGDAQEHLELRGDVTWKPLRGSFRAEWSGLNLTRANHWLADMEITGSSSGSISVRTAGEDHLALSGGASLQGSITLDSHRVTIRQSTLGIDWGDQGLTGKMEVYLADGGVMKGTILSRAPAGLALPSEGNVGLEWSGFDLALLRPWLPEGITLAGAITGRVTGLLLPGSRFDLRGVTQVSGGKVRWRRPGGELSADLRTAKADWTWRGESLDGTASLVMEDYGEAKGTFQVPLPARLPLALNAKGAVRAALSGRFREQGMVTAIFPGLVQESRGEVEVDLQAGGSWEAPRFTGTLRLTKAGAYLPAAGISIGDVQATARLEQDLIRVESFRARSGQGQINGTAVIRLDGWRVESYRGAVDGERFQAVYLPELQVAAAPRLTFEGTPKRLAVRGELTIPELLVYESKGRAQVLPSSDVVIEDAPRPVAAEPPLALDVGIRVLFGDRVLVRAEGIDAQLGGSVDLAFSRWDAITSSGKINVVKGRYKTYGIDLQIVRGHLFYAGGPVNRPLLDILALRTVGEVRAGVTVGGTPQAPVVKLYSEPAMPDIDILAYVVLGHPLGASTEQAGLMGQAAGLLLSAGDSVVLQDQIKQRLGLSTLGIEAAGTTTGRMGYTPVAVAPPGAAPAATAASGLSQSLLTVGKYLTPQLYVSYGRSLFTGSNLLRIRYSIIKGLGIETEMGTESGADLYYKIDFK